MSTLELLIFLPVVGAIIGYVCKWMAIKMLFYPERWMGIGPIGWQGVVQKRAPKFAAGVADTVARSGVSVEHIMPRLDGKQVGELLGPTLDERAPALVREALDHVGPGSWDAMPPPVREQILAQVRQESRRIASVLVEELKPVVKENLDLQGLVVAQLSGANANRLARLFQRVGRRELQVVIYYGAVLGFFIGLVEVAGYAAIERWWLLPIIGAVDGLVNNWFAIQMIFRPLVRTRYFGIFPYQGLFPARQAEISTEYAHMLATEVVSPKDLYEHLRARAGAKIIERGEAVIQREAAMLLGVLGMIKGTPPTAETQAKILATVSAHIAAAAPVLVPLLDEKLREPLGIRSTIETKLQAMDKNEFERVLRGIFEEDELTLILIGGALGGIIGLMQGAFVLATG
jgi:uncharacterized membrane protein YheB (UPF0754 family)